MMVSTGVTGSSLLRLFLNGSQNETVIALILPFYPPPLSDYRENYKGGEGRGGGKKKKKTFSMH